ncbi:MAG: KH domain-containing protein [Candidatus Aenigmatarchaeota archaeon]
MIEFVKIPSERLAVLIGHNGKVKKDLEAKTHTKITIMDDVEIDGESFDVMKAADIVKAIGRGFSPKNAFLLLNEDFELHIITLHGESEKTIRRLMGRVIGREGKTRKKIEEVCGARISVYGKTVAIIGDYRQIEIASKCVEMLLQGRTHGYVYRTLYEMKRRG